ncbi:hypothetical protein EWH99_01025 [Sporolactobacillus sp. THM7-7]|nr:hypothetical protein EWH99_01025 [Sporolactobacillus sp. THM7-7]
MVLNRCTLLLSDDYDGIGKDLPERSCGPLVEEKTNDAVRRFKIFLRKHPEIVENVRTNQKKWRDVYDDWVIFGESHDIWKSYGIKREEKGESGNASPISWNKILNAVDKIDAEQWQKRLDNISGAISGIQQLIGQFQKESRPNGSANQNKESRERIPVSAENHGAPGRQGPFFFRKD